MVRASPSGGIAGYIADQIFNTFPLGTLAGTFHRNLFDLAAGDMDRVHDPARATRGASTADFGDLKGMASGLFGDIKAAFEKHMSGAAPTADPQSDHEARAMGRPMISGEVRDRAQAKSGLGGWGKALLYGGLALGGLTLLRDFSMGGFGMPFYGGMSPFMNPMTHPMMMPGMMPGIFW